MTILFIFISINSFDLLLFFMLFVIFVIFTFLNTCTNLVLIIVNHFFIKIFVTKNNEVSLRHTIFDIFKANYIYKAILYSLLSLIFIVINISQGIENTIQNYQDFSILFSLISNFLYYLICTIKICKINENYSFRAVLLCCFLTMIVSFFPIIISIIFI